MEEIASLFNSIGLILTAILGGASVISLSVAALLYMNPLTVIRNRCNGLKRPSSARSLG